MRIDRTLLAFDWIRTVSVRQFSVTGRVTFARTSHNMAKSLKNLAAWQMEAKGPFAVKENTISEPGEGEIRIKVCI